MAKIYSSGNTLFIGSDVAPIDSGVIATAVTDTGYTDHVKVANTEGLIYVIAPYDEIFEEDGTTNWGTDVTTTVNNLNTLFGDNNPNNYADKTKLDTAVSRINAAEADIATNTSDIATNVLDISDIKKAVQIDLGAGRGIFADDGKGNTKSYLKVADSQAVIQGGVLTRINISEASPGSHSFTVAAGPSGSETEYEALELYGKTTAGTAALELKNGTALSFVNGSYATVFKTETLTAARTIGLPDASGTVALTSDIPSFVGYVDTTGTPANNQVAVFTDQDTIEGSTALIVDGANVGVGTTSPITKLHVVGDGITATNTGGAASLRADRTDGKILALSSGTSGNAFIFDSSGFFGIGAESRSTIEGTYFPNPAKAIYVNGSNENVGIGTTSPAEKLDVEGNINVGTNQSSAKVTFRENAASAKKFEIVSSDTAVRIQSYNNTPIDFQLAGGGAVSFGTKVSFNGGVADLGNNVSFGGGVAGGAGSLVYTKNSTNGATLQTYGSKPLYINPAGNGVTVAAGNLLVNTGNVGIGTTTPSEKLDVVGKANINDGNNNVLISTGNSTITASNTTAVGYQALTALTTGAGNTALGYQAGAALTTNSSVTAVGYQAAYQLATGNHAVAIGYHALENLTTVGGDYGALAIGVRANENKTSLTNSTSIGNRSNAGSEAVAVGGASNASGAGSTAVGQSARAGAYSTVIGHGAGDHFANVARSVLIGRDAGGTNVNSDSVMIGHQAGSQETGTHKLYIENSNSSSPLIYGEFDNDILRVNGTLQVGDPTGTGFKLPTTDGTADQVLSTDGSGNVTWVDTTLEGLPNVVSALTNNEILTYNSTLGYWVGGNSVTLNSVNTNNLTVNSSATFSSAISAPSFLLTSDGESEISVGVLSDDLALKSAGNVRVLLDKDNNETGQKFLVEDPSSTERFSVDDAGVATFNNAYSLPNTDGTSGQVLTTNGSGTASWADAGGGKSSSASGYLEIKSDSMTQLFVGPTNGIFAADYTTGNNDNQSYSHNGTAPTAGSSTISKYPYNVRSGLLDVHHDISTISFNARLRDVSQNAASCEYWVCIWHLSGGAAETFTSQTWTAAAVGTGTFASSSVNTLLSKVVATASGLSISAGDSLWITFGWVDQPAGTPDIPVNWSINMNE